MAEETVICFLRANERLLLCRRETDSGIREVPSKDGGSEPDETAHELCRE